MIVYDVGTKVLDTEIFPQHTMADLNIWYYLLFVQSEEAFTVKGNKHTHTHIHTHTHNTHKFSPVISLVTMKLKIQKNFCIVLETFKFHSFLTAEYQAAITYGFLRLDLLTSNFLVKFNKLHIFVVVFQGWRNRRAVALSTILTAIIWYIVFQLFVHIPDLDFRT